MKSFRKYLSEVYRITPKRRELLGQLEQDAAGDLHTMTQQQDKTLSGYYTGDEDVVSDVVEKDPHFLHNTLFNNPVTYNALSKLARLRRIEAIKQQGIPSDKRQKGFQYFSKSGARQTSAKPTDKFLKNISKTERRREQEFRMMGTPMRRPKV